MNTSAPTIPWKTALVKICPLLPSASLSAFLLFDFQTTHFCTYDCFLIGARITSETQGEHLCWRWTTHWSPSKIMDEQAIADIRDLPRVTHRGRSKREINPGIMCAGQNRMKGKSVCNYRQLAFSWRRNRWKEGSTQYQAICKIKSTTTIPDYCKPNYLIRIVQKGTASQGEKVECHHFQKG